MDTTQKVRHSKSGSRKEFEAPPTQITSLDAPAQSGQDRPEGNNLVAKELSSRKDKNPATAPLSNTHESKGEESLDLITQVPLLSTDILKEVVNTTLIPPEPSIVDQQSHIWGKIQEAQKASNVILTKILLAAYNKLDQPEKPTFPKIMCSLSAMPVLPHMQTKISVENSETVTELEENLAYTFGSVTSHQDIGFTPYFDKNIKKLQTPLPLTNFDREWQKKAIAAHLMLKPSESSEDKAYCGLAYHDEWTQSHSLWTNNHHAFYITLRDVYNKGIFAEKLRIHTENCDTISDVYRFMTEFRYDMQTVRSLGEASWKDNNYAPGFSHASFDPDTALKRPDFHNSSSYPSNLNQEGGQHHRNHQERRREKFWNSGFRKSHSNPGNHPYGFGGRNHQQPFNNHNEYNSYTAKHYPYQQSQGISNQNQGFGGGSKRFKGGYSGFEPGGKSAPNKDGPSDGSSHKQ
ncbi:hypothetical protein PGTUg99_034692 [Puccinia graminis f. sp. tritici]|uniref:Uncharacterized protein n=1 Tax=Puccinia graminis f. sp. tritici TaxID=56615 RepID=A0A5B0RV14_PUCGR|nr:hypothetical protein PGTUg99_034692 [Puccinia graminis f. sp. tritici]